MFATKLLMIMIDKSKLKLLSLTLIVLFQLVSLKDIEPNHRLENPSNRQEQAEESNYYPVEEQLIRAGWSPCLLKYQTRCNNVAILEDLGFDNATPDSKEYKSTKYTADISYLYPDELKMAITQNRVAEKPIYSPVQTEKKIVIKYVPMRYIGYVPSDANVNFERNGKIQKLYDDPDIYPITAKLKLKLKSKYGVNKLSSELTYEPYGNQAHRLFLDPDSLTADDSSSETHYFEFRCSGATTLLKYKDIEIKKCYEDPFYKFLSEHYSSYMRPTTSSIIDGLNFFSRFNNHCAAPEFNRFTGATQIVLHLNKECEVVIADLHANSQDQEYYTSVFRYEETADRVVQGDMYEFIAEFHESDFIFLEELILLIKINFKRESFHPTKALIYHRGNFYKYRIRFHVTGDSEATLAIISDPCFFFKIIKLNKYQTASIKNHKLNIDETNAKVCKRLCTRNCQSLKDSEPDMEAIAKESIRLLRENRDRSQRGRRRAPHLTTVLRILDIAVQRNRIKELDDRSEDIADFASKVAPIESDNADDAVASEEDGAQAKPITADIVGAGAITGEDAGSEVEAISGGAASNNEELGITPVHETLGGMLMDFMF